MKLRMARKKTEAATELSKEIKAKGKFTRAKKCTMKTTSSTKKFHGKDKSGIEEKTPLKSLAESPSSQDKKSIHTENKTREVPIRDLNSSKEVRSSNKMKLQLFPLDAHTCKGLEKDGFHPYLELTLSSRKKISSVLQHINSKWGNSKIAQGGDPTLYPYDKSALASGLKWLANNNITTTTGDVYAAIGSPSLFRLRYGWSSENENKTDEPLPSPLTPGTTASFQNEEPENIISDKTPSAGFTDGLNNQVTESTENNKINDGSGKPTLFSWDDDGLTSLSIGGLLSEVSMKGKFADNNTKNSNNATLWDISLGGFFSEASLQRVIKREQKEESTHNNNESNVSIGDLFPEARFSDKATTQPLISDSLDAFFANRTDQFRAPPPPETPIPLISDSLDAFFGNRTDQSRALCPLPPPESSRSSILDAEDTCHAFSFRKRFTTSQKVLEQVSEEAEDMEKQKDESKSAKPVFGSSMVFNQDCSNGLSAIKWADSRGPFDLGVSSSRKFSNGDSISFGALVKDLQEKMEPLAKNQ